MFKKALKISSYIVYIVFLVFLSLHFLFPEKKGAYFLSSYLKNRYGINFYCDELKLEFPLRFVVIKPSVDYGNIKNINFDKIDIKPQLFSFLIGNFSADLKINGFDGILMAKLSSSSLKSILNFKYDLTFKDLNLKGVKKYLAHGSLAEGIISGKIKGSVKENNGEFTSFIDLVNFNFLSPATLFPLKDFQISRIELKGDINGKKIEIKDSLVRAKAGIADFSGHLNLKKPFERSEINIKGKIIPDILFFGKNRGSEILSMLLPVIKNKKQLSYSIKGMISKPAAGFS